MKTRTCASALLNTGASQCPVDFGKMVGAIIVRYGDKLPSDLTGDKLEELAHADRPERIYGVVRFVEYAKEGGEPQTTTLGYGPEEFNGFSARKDTYTLKSFSPSLHAAFARTAHLQWGAYFFDENNMLYGINDGTEEMAPFPMSSIYSDATPHPTSSNKAQMTVTFCHEDAKMSVVDFDFEQLDFNPTRLTLGLTEVQLVAGEDGSYKIVEKVGKYDATSIYGPLIAGAAESVVTGASAVSYDSAKRTLVLVANEGETPRLASSSVLYKNGIKGVEQV